MYKINEELKQKIIQVLSQVDSMAKAAAMMNMQYKTLRSISKKLNLWQPNPAGKGSHKNRPAIPLVDVLNGLHPQYKTFRLKNRLIKEGYKEKKCEVCGINGLWNNKPLPLELDHINGDSNDHSLNNLRTICPNCHAQTNTYRGKNK